MKKGVIKLSEDGLTGDTLNFVKELNTRFAKLEFPEESDVDLQVRKSLSGLMNEDGTWKVEPAAIAELLSEGDKGLRSVIKKQGIAIEQLKKRGNGSERRSFKEDMQSRMKDIRKVIEAGQGEIKFNVRAAAVMTTGNTIDFAVLPDDILQSYSLGAFVPKRQGVEYIFDVANRTTVANIKRNKIWYEEGSTEGAFAEVAEGGLKPLMSASLVQNHARAFKVAGKHVVTDELDKFEQEVYQLIRRIIQQKVARDYAAKLTTQLLADAAPYVASALDDQYPAAKVTDYHAFAAVAAQIEALNFVPDILVINPQDKWRIGMSADTNGQFYLTIPMIDPNGVQRLMGFRVVTSTKIAVGNFILGESGLWEVEDEPLTIKVGYGIEVTKETIGADELVTEVEHDLDHNRFRVIVETWALSYIATNNDGSFVYANFATVKAAVTAP